MTTIEKVKLIQLKECIESEASEKEQTFHIYAVRKGKQIKQTPYFQNARAFKQASRDIMGSCYHDELETNEVKDIRCDCLHVCVVGIHRGKKTMRIFKHERRCMENYGIKEVCDCQPSDKPATKPAELDLEISEEEMREFEYHQELESLQDELSAEEFKRQEEEWDIIEEEFNARASRQETEKIANNPDIVKIEHEGRRISHFLSWFPKNDSRPKYGLDSNVRRYRYYHLVSKEGKRTTYCQEENRLLHDISKSTKPVNIFCSKFAEYKTNIKEAHEMFLKLIDDCVAKRVKKNDHQMDLI